MTDTELYLLSNEKAGIQVGDRVKVLRKAKHYEQGWENSWDAPMHRHIGLTYEVVRDNRSQGFMLTNGYNFPWFVLEKQERKCVTIELASGQTLQLYTGNIQWGRQLVHLNREPAGERGIHARPVRPLDTKVNAESLTFTYTEFEHVYNTLIRLRELEKLHDPEII